MNEQDAIHKMKEKTGKIEEEIKNVNLLCGQLEVIVNQPKRSLEINTKNINPKKFTTINNEKKLEYKKYKRNKNMSMDFDSNRKDKISPSMKYTPHKNANRSVEHNSKSNMYNRKNTENSTTSNTINTNSMTTNNSVYSRLYRVGKSKKVTEETKTSPKNINLSKPSPKVDDMLNRFKELQIERNNKIKELKKKIQIIEDENLQKVPQINNKSKKIGSSSDDFLARMIKYKESYDQKKKELLEKQEAKKFENENKIIEKLNKKYKHKLDTSEIHNKINNLYQWDNDRKTKLNKLIDSELQKEKEECTFKPDIDKKSNKIANNQKLLLENDEVVERLYKHDVVKRKHKQEILEDIYVPSFTPTVNSSIKNTNWNFESNNANALTDRGKKVNGLDKYITNKDNFMIEEILKERVKIIRTQHNMEN